MSQSPKFQNQDREELIRIVEEHYNIRLSKFGRRQKWMRDNSGRFWWVLGGYDRWHGIPEEMVEAEQESPANGMLVVGLAKWGPRGIDLEVFSGRTETLVREKNRLSLSEKGEYNFVHDIEGDNMYIIGVNGVRVAMLKRIPLNESLKR